MTPMWAWFGHDEPNYTYMKDGRKLLSELAALSPVPVHVRAHNMLTSGDGIAALKWGSTNAYSEDTAGNPKYDWTIVDRIVDTYVERKMKPMIEVGFMPEALSVKPQPYRHHWDPSQPYADIYTGWAHPPRDYKKWSDLVYAWVRHSMERYGRAEVATWYWEVWNEPNIAYWQGKPEEYHKLYDFTVDAIKRALPEIRVGGPTSTGPGNESAAKFLRDLAEGFRLCGTVAGAAGRTYILAGGEVTTLNELAALSMDGYSMATGGILVQVPEEEAEEARELLSLDLSEPE